MSVSIQDLPVSVFGHIFRHFRFPELWAMTRISRFFREAIIETTDSVFLEYDSKWRTPGDLSLVAMAVYKLRHLRNLSIDGRRQVDCFILPQLLLCVFPHLESLTLTETTDRRDRNRTVLFVLLSQTTYLTRYSRICEHFVVMRSCAPSAVPFPGDTQRRSFRSVLPSAWVSP